MISLNNVSKSFGAHLAVNNLTLEVKEGEIYSFLGMNGAGKTTTIKMLTGILKPSSGQIRICGIDMLKEPEKAKSITGYIPDRAYLYEKLTGREFLYFTCELYNLDLNRANIKIDELLASYELIPVEDELIESYSHGMRQRLATCAALIHDPKVLIIDEPMVGLDPRGAKTLKQNLRNYSSRGMTIFLSTHSLNVAEEISDRIGIIKTGELIAEGTPTELKLLSGKHDQNLEEAFLELTNDEMA